MTVSDSAAPTARKRFTLADAWRGLWSYPSPWMLAVTLFAALTLRVVVGDWQITDVVVPVVMLAAFPFFEWVVHVFLLHWRPRRVGRLTIDPLLARKHREHHVDPRNVPLIFIPWQALLWVIPATVAIAGLAFSRLGLGLTYVVFAVALGLAYEWSHYLIHSDYKPKTRLYRAVWRNHRLHHYKNEHYWFTVTSSGTADRVLHTYPDPARVPTSPTAKNLHAVQQGSAPAGYS
jgi:Fatty acid hydroxylase superfamily